MKLSHLIPERGTPADLFLSRYQWLSRWAMQFARNDRSAAEDLIQDTYLRFSQANLKVEDIRDPEALLYTYLEYVHLAHLRQFARHSFTSLAEAKLDALALGLPSGPDVDRIETQNTLRRIAAYVTWRKKTSKSASIVALRFFHGYLPEEIARIALVSRQAIDERLHSGRGEVRLHLMDAEKLRQLQHGGPPEVFPAKFVVPTDELLSELHGQLFAVRHGHCLSAQQLVGLYRKSNPASLSRDLLAHIVSCRSCLAVVDQNFRLDRRHDDLDSGPQSGGFALKRHGPQGERPELSARDIGNAIRRSERRLKEIFEHRPSSLIVAVNGELIASRDTAASLNGLKVEAPMKDLRFIEVLNEYGVSLLSWVVESPPPYGDPVVHLCAQFSMGRRLEVDLQFSAHKLIIEVQYLDSSYAFGLPTSEAIAGCALDEEEDAAFEVIERVRKPRRSRAWWRSLWDRLPTIRVTPWSATAFVCAIVLTASTVLWFQRPASMKPVEFLQQAASAEQQEVASEKSGVILQQVSIRTSRGTIERSIYREVKGRHHQKASSLDEAKSQLKLRLGRAGVNWDEPLSVNSFLKWHASSRILKESVQRAPGELLTLRVDVDSRDVEQETITVRAGDFHPVNKTIEFRDLGMVEIAEVSFAVVPWETVNPNLFDSGSGSLQPAMTPSTLRLVPPSRTPLTPEERDLAALQVRTVLHAVHADANDRLSVSLGPTGVEVRGFVEDERLRADLKRQLNLIPHVSSYLTTASAASGQVPTALASPVVQAASLMAEPSLLETYLLKSGVKLDVSSHIAEELFVASTSLLRANKALLQLKEQFPAEQLSPGALELYTRLYEAWRRELDAAIVQESNAIQQTGMAVSADGGVRPISTNLDAEVQANRTLLQELIGHNQSNARAAPVVIAELARSAGSLHNALLNESKQQLSPGTNIAPPPASKNQP